MNINILCNTGCRYRMNGDGSLQFYPCDQHRSVTLTIERGPDRVVDAVFAADMNDPRGDEPIDVNFDGHLRRLETGEGEAWSKAKREMGAEKKG